MTQWLQEQWTAFRQSNPGDMNDESLAIDDCVDEQWMEELELDNVQHELDDFLRFERCFNDQEIDGHYIPQSCPCCRRPEAVYVAIDGLACWHCSWNFACMPVFLALLFFHCCRLRTCRD
jgi:hypothetical protein